MAGLDACPSCGGTGRTLVWTEEETPIYRCHRCALMYSDRTRIPDQERTHYWDGTVGERDEGGPHEPDFSRIWSDMKRLVFADTLSLISRHAPGRRLLDVGCGPGYFVEHARASGLLAQGIEPGRPACLAANRRLGDDAVKEGLLTVDSYAPGSFDAVTLLNVLEHVVQPKSLLELVARILRPSGVAIIRVPNVSFHLPLAHVRRRVDPRRSWYLGARDHVNQFSVASLRYVLGESGFASVRVVRGAPTLAIEGSCSNAFWFNPVPVFGKRVYYAVGGVVCSATAARLYLLPCVTVVAFRRD